MQLNLGKCTLLATDVVVLGYALCRGSYRLGDKALKKLLSSQIPTTLKELQAVMGKLNYCSRFCPRYNATVAPLRQLLSKQGSHLWTRECTNALNKLVSVACDRMKLHLADWNLPFRLTVDIDPAQSAGAVILSQGDGKRERIVIMVGRELKLREAGATLPEAALKVASWGVKRLSRWVMFS
jgi:RNase H-like domain found in reverse transcriptase